MLAHVLHRGDLFAGRYRVERCIGSGGMGAVYEAEHIETERRIALKVLLPSALMSESARERFKQEARVAAKIRHPNIVDVLDAGVDDLTAMPYLVMELLRGEDLGARIARTGRMDPGEAVALLTEIASALDCLHERQIVHRDLKPENLFLAKGTSGGRTAKLLDFGVAKVIAEGMTSAFTQDAQGTPVYMAPEQFAEQIRISPATDIYALGMLAFTLLTGKQYWGPEIERGVNVFMLARIAEGGPKEPATVRACREGTELDPAFDEWFAIVTAITPGERFPTAGDAIEALAEVLHVDPRAAWDQRDDPDRSDRSAADPIRDARAARSPNAATASDPDGTPPLPPRRAQWSWKRTQILGASLAAVTIAIGLAAALRLARDDPQHVPVNGSAFSSGVIATSSPAPSTSAPVTTSDETPPPPASAQPSSADPLPSTEPVRSSPHPSATVSSSPFKAAPYRPPQRTPASSATVTRKPKYTRD